MTRIAAGDILLNGRTSPFHCEVDTIATNTEKKHRAILSNALKVFAREGFPGADVQIIADLAKVGKGTVYRHFGNKKQLFLATAQYCLQRLGNFVESRLGGEEALPQLLDEVGTIEVLRRIAIACAEYYQKYPQSVEIMIQERAEFREGVFPSHLTFRSQTREGLDGIMKHAIAKGEVRDINVIEASNAFSDLIFGSVINGCLEGGKSKLVERVSHAIDFLLHGLSAKQHAPANK